MSRRLSPNLLALPDLNCPFEVICDDCGVDVVAVLVQRGRPIAFEVKRMQKAEQRDITGEQEPLAGFAVVAYGWY